MSPIQLICREWVKELGPMNWTMANLELEDGPTSTEDTKLNILNV